LTNQNDIMLNEVQHLINTLEQQLEKFHNQKKAGEK